MIDIPDTIRADLEALLRAYPYRSGSIFVSHTDVDGAAAATRVLAWQTMVNLDWRDAAVISFHDTSETRFYPISARVLLGEPVEP